MHQPAAFRPGRVRRAGLAGALALTCSVPSLALAQEDAAQPSWTFGGFGSLGVVHSSERQADFVANILNPGHAGYSRRWAADVDSRLGAQLGVALDRRWSAVLQVVAERNLDGTFRPVVEWANVKYQATPDLSLRAGRIALPLLLAGDYRKASYALTWVRPPVELYGSLPLSNSDGVDASYRWHAGPTRNLTQVLYGHTRLTDTSHLRSRHVTGFANLTTIGALNVRVSVLETRIDTDLLKEFFGAYRNLGPQGAAIAARYGADGKRATMGNIGFSYDPGAWFLTGEMGRVNTRSILGDTSAAYLSAGLRLDDFTPYATYARVRPNMPVRSAGVAGAGLPPPLAAAAGQLDAGLNSLLRTISIGHTVTAGLRWDLHADMALKVQLDRVRPQGGSSGMLIRVQPGFQSGHTVSVASAALDFVF